MNTKLKPLKFIHIALATGLCLAYLFLGNLTQPEAWKLPQFEQNTVIYLAIPLVAMVLSNVVFKLQLKNIPPKQPLEEALPVYQTASIMRWAILEGGAFLILFMAPEFILFGVLIILYFLILHPSQGMIERDLNNNI